MQQRAAGCIKKRGASQCDCQLCTYVEDNLRRWHKARAGWRRIGEERCACRVHQLPLIPPAGAEAEAAWRRAGRGWPTPEPSEADQRQRARAKRYDGMSASPAKLAAALLQCGKRSYPDYSVTGTLYCEYDKLCASGSCQKQIFAPQDACGWQNAFGADCPRESSADKYIWFIWQQQQRGTDADGKPTYSPEWMPHEGTRAEFFVEFR